MNPPRLRLRRTRPVSSESAASSSAVSRHGHDQGGTRGARRTAPKKRKSNEYQIRKRAPRPG